MRESERGSTAPGRGTKARAGALVLVTRATSRHSGGGTPASASPLPCAPFLKGPAPNLGAHFQTFCPLFPVCFMVGKDVPAHHRHHLPSTKLQGPSGKLGFVLPNKLAHREGLQGAHKCIWGCGVAQGTAEFSAEPFATTSALPK